MRNIVGPVVRGNNFLERPYIIEDLWYNIENGVHTLLVAPRRVGKTSLMFKLLDNPKNGYIIIYMITQSAQSANEFWEILFNAFTQDDFISSLKNTTKKFYNKLKSINIDEVGLKGIKFGQRKEIDYNSAFKELLQDFDGDKKLVIMIDEFSQAIEHIVKYENIKSAEKLLHHHKELRNNKRLMSKVVFIYTGSIGLESVVAKFNASGNIQDLNDVKVPPLEKEIAIQFTYDLCNSYSLQINDKEVEYILKKIEWYIPFYIQLMIQEIKKIHRNDPTITIETINQAIKNSLNNKQYFAHWEERLEVLTKNQKKFTIEILNIISKNTKMLSNEIINIAKKHELTNKERKSNIHSLVYDGYINNEDKVTEYRFNSPLLRIWWNKNVAN